MCLERVKAVYERTNKTICTRYKVFAVYKDENGKRLCSPLMFDKNKPLPLGKWLDEKDYRLLGTTGRLTSGDSVPYPVGWHVFVEEKEAATFFLYVGLTVPFVEDIDIKRAIHQVLCRGLLAKGVDRRGRKVEVYKYIKLEQEICVFQG